MFNIVALVRQSWNSHRLSRQKGRLRESALLLSFITQLYIEFTLKLDFIYTVAKIILSHDCVYLYVSIVVNRMCLCKLTDLFNKN